MNEFFSPAAIKERELDEKVALARTRAEFFLLQDKLSIRDTAIYDCHAVLKIGPFRKPVRWDATLKPGYRRMNFFEFQVYKIQQAKEFKDLEKPFITNWN